MIKSSLVGKLLTRDDITRIRISETTQPSANLRPIVEQQIRDSLVGNRFYASLQNNPLQGVFSDAAESYVDSKVAMGIIDAGRDVTNDVIRSSLISGEDTVLSQTRQMQSPDNPHRVFVIHGRNTLARDAMFTFLRSIGLDPIEWEKAVGMTGKPTPTIGEILDAAFSHAQAVVVLMTPDDEAQLRTAFRSDDDPDFESELTGQARPNVLFEAGMAMSRSADRTVLVKVGTLRPFSDIDGLHVVRFNGSIGSRQALADRLKLAQCPVDLLGKSHWHSAGDFSAAIELTATTDPIDWRARQDGNDGAHGNDALPLSQEAAQMISEAAQSSDGVIQTLTLDHDSTVTTNGKYFGQMGNPQSESAAIETLKQLIVRRLVEYVNTDDRGDSRYRVTEEGFNIAHKS